MTTPKWCLIMVKVFGYATSRPFGDFVMPVPAQNSCLREYCKNINGQYIIPQLEHKFDNCYMQLWTTTKAMKSGDVLAIYSAEIVISSLKPITLIKSLATKGIMTHFVLENISIHTPEDMDTILFTKKIRQLTLQKSVLVERIAQS